ncbi:MAG TPA: tetratricopeptide repeat protein [Candidatus Polarisedimenticolia bacterium]|jgi:tetratricopeptide (TPR) repeat protein|nr:tetratricopeptide repeat protein [Candidatus Polarisedimenticolia bacterium]
MQPHPFRRIIALALLTASATGSMLLARPAVSSPAEAQIGAARARIASGRPDVKTYQALAIGLTRRARETGDVSLYSEASEALSEASSREPGNPITQRISAWVALGRHEFAKTYTMTRRYARKHPDDAWNFSVMGDALMELGRPRRAEKAYQAMVDLRPGPSSYCRVAYLREARGDLEGAAELLEMSLQSTPLSETEDRAWLLVQLGHLWQEQGDLAGAEERLRQALSLFPGYHYALAALAAIALETQRPAEAALLARQAIDAAPYAERYLLLADSLRALGREEEARRAEARFEGIALANRDLPDNENHDLVLFYLERRPDPPRALAIARHEAAIREDVPTMDRLAWALHRNGRTGKARRLLKRVAGTGTRDPLVLSHLRLIGESR